MNRRTDPEILNRVPPHNLDNEKAALGCVLLLPDVLDDIADTIEAEDFYLDSHQKIFTCMLEIHEQGKRIDPTLLVDRLKSAEQLEAIGGLPYLLEVADSTATAANAAYYAERILDHSQARQAIHAAAETLREAYDGELGGRAVIENADRRFLEISQGGEKRETVSIGKATGEAVALAADVVENGRQHGVRTGIIPFDSRLGGLFPGELAILAARPRMGKTSLAGQIALNVALRGEPVLFVSLEMSARELAWRLAAGEAGVNSIRLRTRQLTPADLELIREQHEALADVPLLILDKASMTAADVRRAARRSKRKGGLVLLVLDYLQRLAPMDRRANKNDSVGASSRLLKETAQDLEIPVLCLAQLNRQVEAGGNHRPNLGSLRDSGEVEQDADVVMFVHREEVYKPKDRDLHGKADLIVAKNRNGPTDDFKLRWHPESTAFTPWVDESAASPDF